MVGASTDPASHPPIWPDEIASARAAFYGIRTSALIASEPRWVHRRVEQIEFVDEHRFRRHLSVDFTLPNFPAPPWSEPGSEQIWLVPVALLPRRILTRLDVRDAAGASLPALTREQNTMIAFNLLGSLARETLTEVFGEGTRVEDPLLCELSDIAGARRNSADHPSDDERAQRTETAIRRFRSSARRAAQGAELKSRLHNQRQALWRDQDMRGFITTLAERFVLLVSLTAEPGARAIVKLSYEEPVDVPPIISVRDLRGRQFREQAHLVTRALMERAGSSFGVSPHSLSARTRAVYGPESYHVEITAPEELLIEYARLERTTTITDLETSTRRVDATCVAEDRCTERAHLYESLFTAREPTPTPASANEEAVTASTITVDFFMRPSFVRPPLLIGVLTCGLLVTGLVLKWVGVPRSGDVTALIVVLPAVFAAYLIPGEHRLVRRMFRGVRLLVFTLSVVSFAAAGTLTISLASSTRVLLWLILLAVAVGCTGTIGVALWSSTRKAAGARP